jgi:hypothetical protein
VVCGQSLSTIFNTPSREKHDQTIKNNPKNPKKQYFGILNFKFGILCKK